MNLKLLDESRYLEWINRGLPKTSQPQKVLIAGAGIAGLVAASELMRAGYEVQIIEAQQRVGGRILTLRHPFSDGLFAEAGAMRIPTNHSLTLAYINKFRLKTIPFINHNPLAFAYFNGKKIRMHEAEQTIEFFGFELTQAERQKSAEQLWLQTIQPFIRKVEKEGPDVWDSIVQEYDEYSVREFLEIKGWSEAAIERFGLLYNQEAIMNSSFLELLREEVGQYYKEMITIEGAMDQLPLSFLPELQENIWFGQKITAIEQSETSVTFHLRSIAGKHNVTGDFAILTLPFPVLRHIEIIPPFSPRKQKAIRQLHYDASAKIFLQFRRRFWEEEGIMGGGTVTDLAIRNMYYPQPRKSTPRGVLLASYTWGEDAQRWGSLPPAERLHQALENVTAIHPSAQDEFEVGDSYMWHDDEFAGGAFALFDPGQQTLLYDHIRHPEGRIYFAGEHTSLFHAWIQGAIESGLRAAFEITQTTASLTP
ncbi:monoamine oxidase [Bellilinea caldifistulae]|uniref:Amine oxidase n=1 Tax=Bellilinea caldifistulae TaxID=360411 RepID=A0A0P6WTE7_9CHLR|nr:flavin monoamine oxidase family protein [Bellilinea caldifistulae]KPL72462.1 amine oxidase [Bellilinea caldifistulae]GAP10832.1 monoamine oxidase [Bellilinea caldifistulae]